jgi:hypothetical protein
MRVSRPLVATRFFFLFFRKGASNNTAPPPPSQKLPLKIQGDSQSFDITESEYDKQIAHSLTKGREDKSYVCNKKSDILVSNYNIQYRVMNSVSIYGILTKKKIIKHQLRLLLPFMFASWGLRYES